MFGVIINYCGRWVMYFLFGLVFLKKLVVIGFGLMVRIWIL